jgi:hypothetical protein
MTQSIATLVAGFTQQATWCEQLGSPFNAALLRDLAADLVAEGLTAEVIGPWRDDPTESALPLRVTGALHALVLDGQDEDLARFYPPQTMIYGDETWRAVQNALRRHQPFIAAFLQSAPQTNEVRRSAILLGGFLAIAAQYGLPLRLREIGASAGLNLAWPDYRYDMNGWSWGPADSPLVLSSEWRGPPPLVQTQLAIFDRRGCDLNPVLLENPDHRRRLEAYIWPDQRDRLDRMRAAAMIAARLGVTVEQAAADDWLARELTSSPADTCTVLYHSITWQYIAANQRAEIERLIARAGARANAARPFCHLRFEPQNEGGFFLRLQQWPSNQDRILAKADPHGRWIDWRNM